MGFYYESTPRAGRVLPMSSVWLELLSCMEEMVSDLTSRELDEETQRIVKRKMVNVLTLSNGIANQPRVIRIMNLLV